MLLGSAKAQILAEWPLSSKAVDKPVTPFATNIVDSGFVVTDVISYNTSIFTAFTPNGLGLRLKAIVGTGYIWPKLPNPTAVAAPDFTLNFPISPAAGYDLNLTGMSLVDTNAIFAAGVTLAVAPYYQIDGKGAWIAFASPQTFSITSTVNFGTFNQPFYTNSLAKSGHTYTIKLCFYTTSAGVTSINDYFYLTKVIVYGTAKAATIPPTVITNTASSSGKYTAIVNGSYSADTTHQPPISAGVVWSKTANPAISASLFIKDGANGIINSTITGLTANTLYHARAYAVTV